MLPFPFKNLLTWSKTNGRHTLPWRQYFELSIKDLTYHIWLSEILLQQTQADRVIGYYTDILKYFPTVESLAQATYEEFFPHYQGLGYYSRARNMLKCADLVVREYGGVFPNDTEKLVTLPGVGPYTAAAIRAFAYNESVLSFDTNLEKIFARYYHGSRFLKISKEEKRAIESAFTTSWVSGREINAAFMDFWSLVSLNNKPNMDTILAAYPLSDCLWARTQGGLEIQEKKQKIIFPSRDAKIVVVLHENHKIYYSSLADRYQAFVLPATEWDIRHFVQAHFRDQYKLELSVRPVHKKYFENDEPLMLCNAQIQQGTVNFPIYRKENWIFIKSGYTPSII